MSHATALVHPTALEHKSSIRLKLDNAGHDGARRRRAVQLPCLVAAAAILCTFWACSGLAWLLSMTSGPTRQGNVARRVAALGAIVSVLPFLLAVLPSDRVLGHVATGVVLLLVNVVSASNMVVVLARVRLPDRSHSDPGCAVCYELEVVQFVLYVVAISVNVCCAVALFWSRCRRMPPQRRRGWLGPTSLCTGACLVGVRSIGFVLGASYPEDLLTGVAYIAIGIPALIPEFRARTQALLARRGQAVSAATCIAAIIHGTEPEALLTKSMALYRGVHVKDLSAAHFDPALDDVPPPPTKKVPFGSMDAFISHSWSDPPALKWAQLAEWAQAFRAEHRREPVVFVDRYSIPQDDIANNLASLPIWVAGSQTFLVLRGPSWHTRLWCVLELFVHLETAFDFGQGLCVCDISRSADPQQQPEASLTIDAREAVCSDRNDQARLFAIVESHHMGIDGFNRYLREALQETSSRDADQRRRLSKAAWT
mmetsp:Transcript_12072/g.41035  ORF Transcript_12072/g.41035 Transcript_12072/m.41035 type:complete len:483 (-) Transcript_12072:19-1467(-)